MPKPIPLSANHWNGDLVCVIDTETTGLIQGFHEIIQIVVLPLNSRFEIREDVLPFNITMKPDYPDRINPKAMEVNQRDAKELMKYGQSQEAGLDLFLDWFDKTLNPGYKKGGMTRCRILPLGHNFPFDKGHMLAWMGAEFYDEHFHYHHRDSMNLALGINDAYAAKGEPVPFSKVSLNWCSRVCGVVNPHAHDAMGDCITTAKTYKKMLTQFSSVLAV